MSKQALSASPSSVTGDIDSPELLAHVIAIRELSKKTIDNIVAIGGRLADCKRLVGHGNWYSWLRREFDWSRQTADNFINVFEASKTQNFGDLSLPVSSIYLLSASGAPPEAVKAIIERAKKGERLKHEEVKAAVKGKQSAKRTTGNGAAPTEAADTGGPNLTLLSAKLKADHAEIAARRKQEEREAVPVIADVVAATMERAEQAESGAVDAELNTREVKAQALQSLPGEICPQLEDGALTAVDAATLAKRETLAAEIRGLMGKGEPVTSEQPDDDDVEIQKLLALDDAELAKLVAEKTDAERQELRAALGVSQPHLRSLYNLGVRLEGLLGNTAADAIGPSLADNESGAPDSQSDAPIALHTAISALIWWGKHVAALENKLPDNVAFGKADLDGAISKLSRLNKSKAMVARRKARAVAEKAAKAAAKPATVIKVPKKSKETASSKAAPELEFDIIPTNRFGLKGYEVEVGNDCFYRTQVNDADEWAAILMPAEDEIKSSLASQAAAEAACQQHFNDHPELWPQS